MREKQAISLLILNVCSSLVLLLLGCGDTRGRPVELAEVGVVVEGIAYKKDKVFNSEGLKIIKRFTLLDPDQGLEEELLVTGSDGSCLLTKQYEKNRCFSYDIEGLHEFDVIDLEGDGQQEYLAEALWGTPAGAVVDFEGHVTWRYDKRFRACCPGALDMDGDGKLEIVLEERDSGLIFFDRAKRLLKAVPAGNIAELKTYDLDGDGKKEIITIDYSGNLEVRSSAGDVRSKRSLEARISNFDVTSWNEEEGGVIVLSKGETIEVLGADLKTVAALEAPRASRLEVVTSVASLPSGALVSLLYGRGTWRRMLLYIHDGDGTLVYQEILEGAYRGLFVLDDDGTAPTFLVGGWDEIWLYTPTL